MSAGPGAPGPGWIERAQIHLGTLVTVGVRGVEDATAHAAIDRAFGAVAEVHRLMSFHDPGSDVSRLNRDAAAGHPVRVDPRTAEVLAIALELSAATDGAFDVTVAPRLVAQDLLPRPERAPAPAEEATWRDVEFIAAHEIAFRRPLWIDLGGIAKGYAVDAAMACLPADPAVQRRVNAGGDLRVAGPGTERVLLKVPGLAADALPMIEIADGSVASSATSGSGVRGVPHIDGRSRAPLGAGRFASVVAERCVIADALTKVVLAEDEGAAAILARCGATAHVHAPDRGWRTLGG